MGLESRTEIRVMMAFLIVLFCAACGFAQAPSSDGTAACGPETANFKVKLDDTQHTPAHPEAGKARVYFFSDAGTPHTLGYPTSKLGMDGAWVGANHGNSYFSVSIDPGEHHVCAALQSSIVSDRVELAHFTAEAGQVYYYRTRLIMSKTVEMLELDRVDSDEGKYLIGSLPLSSSQLKK